LVAHVKLGNSAVNPAHRLTGQGAPSQWPSTFCSRPAGWLARGAVRLHAEATAMPLVDGFLPALRLALGEVRQGCRRAAPCPSSDYFAHWRRTSLDHGLGIALHRSSASLRVVRTSVPTMACGTRRALGRIDAFACHSNATDRPNLRLKSRCTVKPAVRRFLDVSPAEGGLAAVSTSGREALTWGRAERATQMRSARCATVCRVNRPLTLTP